jgi:hypothetical protein
MFKLTQILLKKGTYRIRFKGDAQNSVGAMADLIFGFTGYKVEEKSLPIEQKQDFAINHIFKVETSTAVDVRLKFSGQGTLILDTVVIIPADGSE